MFQGFYLSHKPWIIQLEHLDLFPYLTMVKNLGLFPIMRNILYIPISLLDVTNPLEEIWGLKWAS